MRIKPTRILASLLVILIIAFLLYHPHFRSDVITSNHPGWYSHRKHTPNAESTLLLLKTGAKTLQRRLPIHLSILDDADIPYYVLYSDLPDDISHHTVIDILSNVSTTISENQQFRPWHIQRNLRKDGLNVGKAAVDGGWTLDKFKFLPMFAHAYRTYPGMKWYFFLEDDSFVFWNQLHRWLASENMMKAAEKGKKLYTGSPNALPNPKFKGEEAIKKGIKFAHGGSGVLLSNAAMKEVFGRWNQVEHAYDARALAICCGDVLLGEVLRDGGVELSPQDMGGRMRFQGEPPNRIGYTPVNWCEPILSFHHVSPVEIGELYEFESRWEGEDVIRYRDAYRYFVKPYLIGSARIKWDNLAADSNVTIGADIANPALACETKCTEWMYCLQWKLEGRQCQLGQTARLGVESNDATSGWLMDRINTQLQDIQCGKID